MGVILWWICVSLPILSAGVFFIVAVFEKPKANQSRDGIGAVIQ